MAGTSAEIANISDVPVLKYLKDPAGTLNSVYERYPDGGEYGWYLFVADIATFVWWDTEAGRWKLLTRFAPIPDNTELGDGDIYVWDVNTQMFEIHNISIINTEEF